MVNSLLTAIVRADGDALVMHVGERPYVVASSGPVELSSRPLTMEAVAGMLGQLLPSDTRRVLDELGAIEHELPKSSADVGDRFTVVAARGGEDIWIEVRRHRKMMPAPRVAAPLPPAFAQPAPAQATAPVPRLEPVSPDVLAAAAAVAAGEPALAGVAMSSAVEGGVAPRPVGAPASIETASIPGAAVMEAPVAVTAAAAPASVAVAVSTEPSAAPDTVAEMAVPAAGVAEAMPGAAIASSTAPPVGEAPVRQPLPFAAFVAASVVEPMPLDAPAAPMPAPAEVAEVAAPAAPPVAEAPTALPLQVAANPVEQPSVETPFDEIARVPVFEPPVAAPPAPAPLAAAHPAPAPAPPVALPAAAHPAPAPAPPVALPVAAHPAPAPAPPVALPLDVAAAWLTAEARAKQQPTSARQTLTTVVAPPTPAVESVVQPLFPSPIIERRGLAEVAAPAAAAPASSSEPAVVLPLARNPIRMDQPTRSLPSARIAGIDRLLRLSAARGANTLYLMSQARPSVRVDGEIVVLEGEPVLTAPEVESLLLDLAPERNREALEAGEGTEWMSEVPEVGRIRCQSFRDHRGPGGIFRMISARPTTAEQLGLAREIQALCAEPEGLVLVAGPRASGKSTLVSALVDLINRTRNDYVITVESQIKFAHESRGCLVSQREVRGSNDDLAMVVRAALRENPDVLVIEDMRSPEVVRLALEAMESGHLVIGAVSAHGAATGIGRILDQFPEERRTQMQLALAEGLRGVISQVLLRKTAGGRVAAREVLLNLPSIANLIAEGRISQLPLAIDSGRKHGMVPLNDALAAFVQSGVVDAKEAYRKAFERQAFLAVLRREGVDTSFVERLA